MTSNWKYSIVEAGRKMQPSQGNLDNEDKFVCNVICTSCSTCFQKDDPESFTCCGFIKNDTEACKYPFQVLNWVAVIGHLASFIAMSIIYANVDEPFNIPYTETYIQWERLNTTVTVSPTVIPTVTTTSPPVLVNQKLRRLNEVVLSNGCPAGKGRINTTAPDEGDFCIGVTTENIPDSGVNLGILIICFHVLSFLFQGAAGLTAFYPSGIYGFQYTVEIQSGRNLLRFIEYGFSASIMLIAIALLNGVTDVNLIACIAVLTAATQLCGLVCEYLLALRIDDPQKKQNMFYVALIMHLTAWLQFLCAYGVIMHGFLRSATQDKDIQPPSFVYVIVWAIFAFYAVFGAVQVTEILCLKTTQ